MRIDKIITASKLKEYYRIKIKNMAKIEKGSNSEQLGEPDARHEIERFCAGIAVDVNRPGAFALETNLDNDRVGVKIYGKKFVGAKQGKVLAEFLKKANDGYDHRGARIAGEEQIIKQFEQFVQDELTAEVAGVLHDEWRRPRRRKETGDYEPRLKVTKDQTWIDAHGGQNQVDIANTNYEDLPADWQAENKASAAVAVGEVLRVFRGNRDMEHAFNASRLSDHYGYLDYGIGGISKNVERMSGIVHEEWLKRNGE